MELKDILNQRLDILEENHVICKKSCRLFQKSSGTDPGRKS